MRTQTRFHLGFVVIWEKLIVFVLLIHDFCLLFDCVLFGDTVFSHNKTYVCLVPTQGKRKMEKSSDSTSLVYIDFDKICTVQVERVFFGFWFTWRRLALKMENP